MKKLLVALTVVIFAVGLALPTAAALPDPAVTPNGYHEVYEYVNNQWVAIDPMFKYAEMYSKISNIEQYRFESDPAAVVCTSPYREPEPEDPIQKTIINRLHLFPWIEIHFNQTLLIWDIFKPGNYMAKAFIIGLQANTPVLIHFGSGTFDVPVAFEGGQDNGHIVMGPITKPDVPEVTIGDKERVYSLIDKADAEAGTPPDVIDVMWWWVQGDIDDWNAPHLMTNAVPAKDNVVPSPSPGWPTGWVKAPTMNSNYTIVPDTEELHYGKYIVFYEDILVEPSDSQGKYLEKFVITICPDP